LGMGQPHQLRGLGECCKLPQRGRRRVFLHYVQPDCPPLSLSSCVDLLVYTCSYACDWGTNTWLVPLTVRCGTCPLCLPCSDAYAHMCSFLTVCSTPPVLLVISGSATDYIYSSIFLDVTSTDFIFMLLFKKKILGMFKLKLR